MATGTKIPRPEETTQSSAAHSAGRDDLHEIQSNQRTQVEGGASGP